MNTCCQNKQLLTKTINAALGTLETHDPTQLKKEILTIKSMTKEKEADRQQMNITFTVDKTTIYIHHLGWTT